MKGLFKKTVSASQELCITSLCSLHSENGHSRIHTSICNIHTTRCLPIRVRGGGAAAPVVMLIFVCAVNFDSRRHTLLSMGFDNVGIGCEREAAPRTSGTQPTINTEIFWQVWKHLPSLCFDLWHPESLIWRLATRHHLFPNRYFEMPVRFAR